MGHKQLSQQERYQISTLHAEKFSICHIAQCLGRSPSTISRELKRNSDRHGYRPIQAHEKATSRASESRALNVARIHPSVYPLVVHLLQCQWSPQQISKKIEREYGIQISHETIYQFILQDKRKGGSLYLNLRRKHKKYQRRLGNANRRGQIKDRRSIDTRPASVETRAQVGHWEGDTVIGTQKKGTVIVTLVERKSRFLVARLSPAKSANEVAAAIKDGLKGIAPTVKTITFDNGKEFANHQEIAEELDCDVFFAHPYHSWERGTNENTNGLLRQYFPKGHSLDEVTEEQLQRVVDLINNRPRQILDYETPQEVFNRALNYQQRRIQSQNLSPV